MLRVALMAAVVGVTVQTPLHHKRPECGYKGCPQTRSDALNVHIVPHTHDDVGWLKTVDQYYYGSRNNIQKAGVQYILDSVVKELWEDPKRRFIYVETACFWKWWTRQNEDVKTRVRQLVDQGRLQFVGGAWSMNDEAATHYQSTIDQFTHGLRKLNDTFGPCALPRVGWQIDPFGHSREFASNLAQMGYDGLFLGRIDFQDKANRKRNMNMEMVWRGDDSLGEASDIFTGVLYNTYSPPAGFCFDVLCDDEPIIDDPDSPIYNVDRRITDFIEYVTNQSQYYRTNNVIVTMGGDFTYQDATMWYTNLDKLIKYTNMKAAKDGLNITLFYSTPNCYLKAVKDANPILPTKQDDFFPYASDPTAYWTGYYTSRPTTKYFEREANGYLQMAKQLQVLAGLEYHNVFILDELKSAMGVMQHHDAVTGTEKQHVTHDYERMLSQAVEDSLFITREALNKMTQKDPLKPPLFPYVRCHLNESQCEASENNDHFVVTVYNPVGWTLVGIPVRIPVVEGTYEVFAPNGKAITTQLVAIIPRVMKIPTRKNSKATHELCFIAKDIKPLGYKSFYVQRKATKTRRDTRASGKYNEYAYTDINDYWKDIKQRSDVKILEDQYENFKDFGFINPKIEMYDSFNNKNNRYRVNDGDGIHGYIGNFDSVDDVVKTSGVMRDRGDVYNKNIDELEKLMEDAKRNPTESPRSFTKDRSQEAKYLNLNDDEMRMLSDDPRVPDIDTVPLSGGGEVKIQINETTGEVKLTFPDVFIHVLTGLYYYPGSVGNNEETANRSSGAYIFRPNATKPIPIELKECKKTHGPVLREITCESDYGALTLISYNGTYSGTVFDWVIGPIPIADNVGKEIIIKHTSNIENGKVFYTDSNGRQLLKRKLNERPQYNLTLEEPIAGNYYPITSMIRIEDSEKDMTILTDRSNGGSVLRSGDVELMLHRRLLNDDAFGVGEALNETANGVGLMVRGSQHVHHLFRPQRQKQLAIENHLRPQILISEAKEVDLKRWLTFNNCYGHLNQDLPFGAHLLTLEPWGEKSLLLRLENYFNKGDAKETVTVDLSKLYARLKVKAMKETTLAANQWKDEERRWVWKTENEFSENFNEAYGNTAAKKAVESSDNETDDGFKIKLKAKQIRTFIVNYEMEN